MTAGAWRLCTPLLLLPFVSAEQKELTAEPGQDVTLKCGAPNSYMIVEWSRADLRDEHVFVYRGGRFVPEEQHPSFKNRVDLQDRQMKDGDVSVILKNVTAADSGTYECRVQTDGYSSMQLMDIITLSVVPPPGPAGGTTEGGVSRGHLGLIVCLSLFLIAVVVAYCLFNMFHLGISCCCH